MRIGSPRHIGLLVLLLAIVVVLPVDAAPDAISLDRRLADLTTALEPEFWDGRLLLTYQTAGPRPIRYVGVRFEHEDWRHLHIFVRHEQWEELPQSDPETGVTTDTKIRRPDWDLFYLVYGDLPEDGLVRYRIVVDGLWTTDPQNPAVEIDPETGLSFSVARSPDPIVEPPRNPQVLSDRRIKLTYSGATGSNVSVAGDFNGWDPYMHPLTEDPHGSGTYTIEMRIPPGTQRYAFYVGGNRVLDPLNKEWLVDPEGRILYLLGDPTGP